jgi:hypothetical protein
MRRIWFAVMSLAFIGCAPSRSEPGALPAARVNTRSTSQQRQQPLLPASFDAPVLRAIPPTATFAWVDPSATFKGFDKRDVESAHAVLVEGRDDVAAVLRANGWREAAPDSAMFHLAMVRAERLVEQQVMRADPRSGRSRPPRCEPAGGGSSKMICREQPASQYPPMRSSVMHTVRTVGYSIRRVEDGATAFWITGAPDDDARRLFSRRTVELLLAVEKVPH